MDIGLILNCKKININKVVNINSCTFIISIRTIQNNDNDNSDNN